MAQVMSWDIDVNFFAEFYSMILRGHRGVKNLGDFYNMILGDMGGEKFR